MSAASAAPPEPAAGGRHQSKTQQQSQQQTISGGSVAAAPTHLTPKRRKLVPLRDHLGLLHRGMPGSGPRPGDVASGHAAAPSSSVSTMAVSAPIQLTHQASGSSRRHARCPLEHIDPSYTAMSGLCAASEVGTPRGGSIRIQHVTAAAAAAAAQHHSTGGGPCSSSGPASLGCGGSGPSSDTSSGEAPVRFPRLDECAHFHYENVELGPLQVRLYEEELKALQEPQLTDEDEGPPLCVQVCSNGRAWLLRRAPRDFRSLDAQLHRCVWDRKFSALPDLEVALRFSDLEHETQEECARRVLSAYLGRFSALASSIINCGPVLSWLELDNRGRRLIVTEDNAINTPAVAAAYAVRRYVAQAADEISFEVGDMISVIDMPPPQESIWWRGKRGFEVGFFPCDTVAVIGEKVPKNLHLTAAPTSSSSGNQAGSSPPVAAALQSSSSLPSKPVLRKHGKLIAFFRSFILNRPSRRRLKQSGILKERVFGCDLGEHLLNSGHEIPMVLKCCAEFIESSGIVDGIYRLSGVTSNIQKLRNAFDEDRIPALYEDESILQDIHSVASLLKMYFRELPNPLCTYQLYPSFVAAVQARENERLVRMREAVQKLPPPHYRTLEYLIRHLARVAARGHDTGMTPRNVAIVWAPNLLRCKELEVGGLGALQGVGVQAVVTEFLVCCCDLIFCDSLPAETDTPAISEQAVSTLRRGGTRPKSLAISTPTKLLSLEEARSRALGHPGQEFIEVGGGPTQLPGKYHTVIELPGRKRVSSLKAKRSPLGWRSLFGGGGSGGKSSRFAASKQRKSATPTDMEQAGLQSEVLQPRRPLRPVKSAESLGSSGGGSARNSAALDLGDVTSPQQQQQQCSIAAPASPESPVSAAGPLPSSCTVAIHTSFLPAKPSHNRVSTAWVRRGMESVSHDSYFDLLSSMSQAEDEGEEEDEGSLDLSEIQLNFELEESEMRIFSEDETLASGASPASHYSRSCHRATAGPGMPRARFEELSMSSADPSPKKNKKSGSNSPGSRKRSRTITPHSVKVEEMRYIDSQSPEPATLGTSATSGGGTVMCTAAEVHEVERYAMPTRGCSSGSSGLTTPGSPPRYAPLLSEAPSPLSPATEHTAGSLEGLYENIAAGDWESVSPDISLVYQNVIPVTPSTPLPPQSPRSPQVTSSAPATSEETIYEDVETVRRNETVSMRPAQQQVDPEEVYQQVKAFRRSVAEVNELMLRVSPSISPPAEPESRKSWSPAVLPAADSEELRRRFDSEIGRDIVRERRMRNELARVRADSAPNSPALSPSLMDRAGSSSLQMSPTSGSLAACTDGATTTAAPLLPSSEGSLTSLSSASFDPLSPLAPSSPLPPSGKPQLGPSPSPLSPSPLSSPERLVCTISMLENKRRLSAPESRDASFSSSLLSPESPPRSTLPPAHAETTCKLALSPILSSGSERPSHRHSCNTADTSPASLPPSIDAASSPEQLESRTAETSPGNSRPHSLNLSSPERAQQTSDTSPGSPLNSRPPSLPSTGHKYSLMSGDPSPTRSTSRGSLHRHGVYEIINNECNLTESLKLASPQRHDLMTGELSPTRPPLQGPLSPQRHTVIPCATLNAQRHDVSEEQSPTRPTSLSFQTHESSQTQGFPSPPRDEHHSPVRTASLEIPSPQKIGTDDFTGMEQRDSRPTSTAATSPINSRATSVSAQVSSLGSLSNSRPASLSLSSPGQSTSTRSSPISPEQLKESTEEAVELREKETVDDRILRPKSAPSSTVRVHLTLTSRRSSEPPVTAKTLSLADSRRLSNRKASVRELLSQFEEVGNARPLPPCLRARAVKSQLAKSLDEERFSEHALFRVRTSPDVTSESAAQSKPEASEEPQTTTRQMLLPINMEDPERRERIERYKEERRNFLREKYRSDSFREQADDDIVARLKQKTKRSHTADSEDCYTARSRSQSESGTSSQQQRRNRILHSPTDPLQEVSENTPPPT